MHKIKIKVLLRRVNWIAGHFSKSTSEKDCFFSGPHEKKISLNVRKKKGSTWLEGQDLEGFNPNKDLVGLLCFSFQFAQITRVSALNTLPGEANSHRLLENKRHLWERFSFWCKNLCPLWANQKVLRAVPVPWTLFPFLSTFQSGWFWCGIFAQMFFTVSQSCHHC